MKLCSSITHPNPPKEGARLPRINFQKAKKKKKKQWIFKGSCSLPHTEGDTQTVVMVEKSAKAQEDAQDDGMTAHMPTCPAASTSLLLGVIDLPVWRVCDLLSLFLF